MKIKNKTLSFKQIIAELNRLGDAEKILFKEQKFGIISTHSLGVYHRDLAEIAKQTGRNNALAIQLFDSGIYEARILCSKIYNPKDLTEELIEKWVVTFENWEICDSFCMGLFAKSKFAVQKALEWTERKNEFEKRAGFTLIASYCMADKQAENSVYEQFLPLIEREATDDRIYVKKAVNWALRNIGKRNVDLNKKAIHTANKILKSDNKAAKWIAQDALKELKSDTVNILNYPRTIYKKRSK